MSRQPPYSTHFQQLDGITAQIVAPDGRWYFLRRERMPIKQALTEICNEIDILYPGWKIEVLTSPTTIKRDLEGSRAYTREKANADFPTVPKGAVAFPERILLGFVGRLDLWARNGRP